MCIKEGAMFVDVWDHLINYKSLFAEDGLHFNCVGKARMGWVLDAEVKI